MTHLVIFFLSLSIYLSISPLVSSLCDSLSFISVAFRRSVSLCDSVCLSVCLLVSLWLSVCVCLSVSIYLSISRCLSLSVCHVLILASLSLPTKNRSIGISSDKFSVSIYRCRIRQFCISMSLYIYKHIYKRKQALSCTQTGGKVHRHLLVLTQALISTLIGVEYTHRCPHVFLCTPTARGIHTGGKSRAHFKITFTLLLLLLLRLLLLLPPPPPPLLVLLLLLELLQLLPLLFCYNYCCHYYYR